MSIFRIISLVILVLGLNACGQKKYFPFSEKELDFVAYAEGQKIRFTDTNNLVNELMQTQYSKQYQEFSSIFITEFIEHYSVKYTPLASGTVRHSIELGANGPDNGGNLLLRVNDYYASHNPDSLQPLNTPMAINGRNYTKVYALKAYKGGQGLFKPDSATIYFNRQFGLIQMLLRNGKAITRVD